MLTIDGLTIGDSVFEVKLDRVFDQSARLGFGFPLRVTTLKAGTNCQEAPLFVPLDDDSELILGHLRRSIEEPRRRGEAAKNALCRCARQLRGTLRLELVAVNHQLLEGPPEFALRRAMNVATLILAAVATDPHEKEEEAAK